MKIADIKAAKRSADAELRGLFAACVKVEFWFFLRKTDLNKRKTNSRTGKNDFNFIIEKPENFRVGIGKTFCENLEKTEKTIRAESTNIKKWTSEIIAEKNLFKNENWRI